jgi:hypothetical protein
MSLASLARRVRVKSSEYTKSIEVAPAACIKYQQGNRLDAEWAELTEPEAIFPASHLPKPSLSFLNANMDLNLSLKAKFRA